MGYKNYAQQKAVWADRKDGGKNHPDKKKGSPAKAHGGPHLGERHDIKQRMKFDPENRKRVEAMPQHVKDSLQAAAWEYGGPFYSPKFQVNVDPEDGVLSNRPIYSDGTMLTYPSLSKPVKRETEANKPPTPLNHCSSSMMHSEAWNEMRKNNSPNTTGNKAGIAHNKKMREAIGTFKMPHSPLNQNNKIKKDSLGKEDAWAKWEKGYMDRKYKFKGTPYQKPLTREENIREMESERSEFMYDPKIGKIRLRKTDDADIAIERKSSNGKDACYHKVKKAVKVWPSAYASGQLVQCRKRGASNWGVGKKK